MMNLSASIKRLLIHLPWVLGVILGVWYVVGLFGNFLELVSVGDRVKEAQQEVSQLEKRNEDLKQQVNLYEGEEMDETLIREELGLVKPGEKVVMIDDSLLDKVEAESKKSEKMVDDFPVWRKWLALVWY